MLPFGLTTFSPTNRRLIGLLIASHLVWCAVLVCFWAFGALWTAPAQVWSIVWVAFQLYAAAQLLLPVLLMHPEDRSRAFYLFWAIFLGGLIWMTNQIDPPAGWRSLLEIGKSGLLMLAATVTGAALARYINRLWELIPVCLAMTLADFASWLYGPTARFAQDIGNYYRAPVGPPPLIDMVLIKVALPGSAGPAPIFGISDWIMVVFFAIVARRHGINDNLVGGRGEGLARRGLIGAYLPVSVVALMAAVALAQGTGFFLPALPLIALVMLVWYGLRSLRGGRPDAAVGRKAPRE